MRIVLDSNILIDVEKKKENSIELLKKLIEKKDTVSISSITVAEILIGSYSTLNFSIALQKSHRLLSQFDSISFDDDIAEKTAQYMAYLFAIGRPNGFQDCAIAATFKLSDSDFLISLNKSHFEHLPDLKGKVFTPQEFLNLSAN